MRDQISGLGKRSHPEREWMVAYVTGSCSAEGRQAVEEHCLDCQVCRTQLVTLFHLVVYRKDESEQREFAHFMAFGEEAAVQAREIMRMHEQWNEEVSFSWAELGKKFQIIPPMLKHALIILALIGGSLGIYFVFISPSSDERTLSRVRDVYSSSTRILQARVTGGFAHQQFVLTRGPGDPKGIDEGQRVTLLSEINQEVLTHQRAATRHNLGRLFMLQGDLDPAEEQFRLALRESPNDAELHIDLGALYYERSRKRGYEDPEQLETAADYHSKAIELNPKIQEAWFNRALCYEQMRLFLQADSDWNHYLELDSKSRWADEARDHLEKLRERTVRLEKLEQNVQADFLAAYDAGDELKIRELVSGHYALLQNLALEQIFDKYLAAAIAGEKQQAKQYLGQLNRIGQLMKEIKKDHLIADTVYFVMPGNSAVIREVQAIRQTLNQAKQERRRGSLGSSNSLYQNARQAAERIGDFSHAEIATIALTRYCDPQSESREITSLRKQLVVDTERRHHPQQQARALLALANAEGATQQFSLSLEHSVQAAEIAKELGDIETAVTALRFSSRAYSTLGDYDPAEQKSYEAISLINDNQVSQNTALLVYGDMGETLFEMGQYFRALPYQREAMRMAEKSSNVMISAIVLQKLGLIYGMLDRHEEAKLYLDDAIARTEAMKDQKGRLLAQIELYTKSGDFYLQKNRFSDAIAVYQRAIETLGSGNNRIFLSSVRQGLAKAYLAQGRLAEAEAELRASIKLSEEARDQISDARSRSTFLATRQSVYRAMVSFQFFNKNDQTQAFNFAEIAKGRELLDALSGSTAINESDGQVKLALSHSATPLTLDQVQKSLSPGTQLIQYIAGEKDLMIWLVTRDRVTTASLEIGAGNLRSKVKAYLDELRTRGSLDSLNRQSSELYRLLITPLSKYLDRSGTLCIVPDVGLQDLPFASLFSAETKHYLIEDFPIVINPSASVFARTIEIAHGKQKNQSESFLGLGNPRFNQQRYPKLDLLPASEHELQRIQSYYPQHLILNQRKATESALINQLGKYEIVHLATHTLQDEKSSLNSTMLLAEETDNQNRDSFDGALQAQEIYRLKPERTRLVVLSSCRSGLGEESGSEAIGGLAQAFHVAGVPTVVASLWDIDDESTAVLMEKFHANHRFKKLSFGEALRQAQLSFLQTSNPRKRHPFFWATTIVTGNGLGD